MFKIPSLSTSSLKKPPGVTLFNWSDITKCSVLGCGSYSQVSLYRKGNGERVAIKQFNNFCSAKSVYKEAVIMSKLVHPNIIRLLGVSSSNPQALMMEYASFDLSPFGQESQVSSLSELLSVLDDDGFNDFSHIQMFASQGIVDGLCYLHDHDIAHRDLKPQNILVSNQHYATADITELSNNWSSCPLIIKFTDFGESRSNFIQTNTVMETVTKDTYRGSPAYMAPEILTHKYMHASAPVTLQDLKAMDVWSMCMVLHSLLSPDLSTPYEMDLYGCCGKRLQDTEQFIVNLLQRGKLPSLSPKYDAQRHTIWKPLLLLYNFCAVVSANKRPTMLEVKQFLADNATLTSDDNDISHSTISWSSDFAPHEQTTSPGFCPQTDLHNRNHSSPDRRDRSHLLSINSSPDRRDRSHLLSINSSPDRRDRSRLLSSNSSPEHRDRSRLLSSNSSPDLNSSPDRRDRSHLLSINSSPDRRDRSRLLSSNSSPEHRDRSRLLSSNSSPEHRDRSRLLSINSSPEHRDRSRLLSSNSSPEHRDRSRLLSINSSPDHRDHSRLLSINSSPDHRDRSCLLNRSNTQSLSVSTISESISSDSGFSTKDGNDCHKDGKHPRFPLFIWRNCEQETIIPFDVDGLRKFVIPCERKNMMKVSVDGRPWKIWMSSNRTNFSGIRRIAACNGSSACYQESCKINGINNRVQFQKLGGVRTCSICGLPAKDVPCHARKIWEYNKGKVEVMYFGNHTCLAKLKTQRKSIENLLRKNPGCSAGAVLRNEMESMMRESNIDWNSMEEVATMFSNRNQVQNVKRDLSVDENGHSFDAISAFKRKCDEYDKYLIFRFNSEVMNNGQPTYIFKSSRKMAELAIEMDRRNGTCKEYAYVDAKHDRVKGMKSLTVWMFHPQQRRMFCLAVMEAMEESGPNIALLWDTFNDMLREVTGNLMYIFNPLGWVVDEHAANWTAIEAVFGTEGIQRTVSCEFHFKQSLEKHSKKILDSTKFKEIGNDMLEALTEREYSEAYEKMRELSEKNSSIFDYWLKWWDKRRSHVFRAFKAIDSPNVNLAEVGHALMSNSGQHNMLLIKACHADVMLFVRQKSEFEAFQNGRGALGRGPSISTRNHLSYKKQMACAKAFSRDIGEFQDVSVYVPTSGIHRPRNKKTKLKNKKLTKNSKVSKISPDMQAEVEVVESFNPLLNYTEPYHNNSCFVLFLASSLTKESKCASCDIALPTNPSRPHDLLIKHKERYGYPNGAGKYVFTKAKTRDIIYHSTDICIRRRHPYFAANRLVIEEAALAALKPVHVQLIVEQFSADVKQLPIIS